MKCGIITFNHIIDKNDELSEIAELYINNIYESLISAQKQGYINSTFYTFRNDNDELFLEINLREGYSDNESNVFETIIESICVDVFPQDILDLTIWYYDGSWESYDLTTDRFEKFIVMHIPPVIPDSLKLNIH